MILSGKFDPGKLFTSDKSLLRVSEKIMEDMEGFNIATAQQNKTSRKATPSSLTVEMESFMMRFYVETLKMCSLFGFSKTVFENHNTLETVDKCGRRFRYIGRNHRGQKNPSLIRILGTDRIVFGCVNFFLEHTVCGTLQHWIIVDLYPVPEKVGKYYLLQDNVIGQKLYHDSVVSCPLVYVKDSDGLWILNA